MGIVDSGVGGLSVYLPLRSRLEDMDFVYLADAAFAPYGTKTQDQIRRRLSQQVIPWFVQRGAEIIVLACNTATVNAIDDLRRQFPKIQFIGIEPAVKPAAEECDRIVVLGTDSTIGNARYQALVAEHAAGATVWNVGAPELVAQVEEGRLTDTSALDRLLQVSVREPQAVVIGCTHFSFLKAALLERWPWLQIYDGADGVVREATKWGRMLGFTRGEGKSAFFTTGPARVVKFVSPQIAFHHTELKDSDEHH